MALWAVFSLNEKGKEFPKEGRNARIALKILASLNKEVRPPMSQFSQHFPDKEQIHLSKAKNT